MSVADELMLGLGVLLVAVGIVSAFLWVGDRLLDWWVGRQHAADIVERTIDTDNGPLVVRGPREIIDQVKWIPLRDDG